ncbi:universal stress protein [Antarcticibacterium flavum]|uniref:Universal stress protein n=1 Tax=Antarcticibacterium flavum TaxID=2058175 RepID=A0A5B7X548_9FLAO|nr:MULTISPECIES: universal stress protein [Antarcticibacterium]MCM4158470.1 universal stress protein [Antarcticibacterium sp. W02-3]QCY70225.1 universal stress protein [Antarcticibacterium flavum]
MNNILVPTNFSKNCRKAEELGIKMAKLYNAEIHFLHLMNTPVDWVNLDKQKELRYPETARNIGSARADLRELEKQAEREGLRCRVFLEFNGDLDNILNHSGHFKHDFIITGSSGTKGGIRELLGSNVEEIVRKADVPVIVVKDQEVCFPFKNILFVSNFEEDVTEAFTRVKSIADKCLARIHLLKVNTEKNYNNIESGLKPLQKFVEKFPSLKDYSLNVYNEPGVEKGINNYLQYKNADLIAMCTHGRTGFLSLFSSSTVEKVTNHSDLPVMTIRIER